MTKAQLVCHFCDLNDGKFEDFDEDVEKVMKLKYEKITQDLMCDFDTILSKTKRYSSLYNSKNLSSEWMYICLNFYILELLNDELSRSSMNVLSVQEIKNIKSSLRNLLLIGILKYLQPNLPHSVKVTTSEEGDIIYKYNLLKCSTLGFVNIINYANMRMLIIPHFLQPVLVAVLQIAYCPLKKPIRKTEGEEKVIITEEVFNGFLKDQQLFNGILEKLRQNIHPSIFVKEIMVLFQANVPIWFKKSVSNNLTKMMLARKGVEHITVAMLDGCDNDSTKTWKILDVLTKLITSCFKLSDLQQNMCSQVLHLLDVVKGTERDLLLFERLVVSCTKVLYSEEKDLCEKVFFRRITSPLLYLTDEAHKFRENDDVTDNIKQSVRLIYGCIVDNSVNSVCLPVEETKTLLNVMFHFFHLTVNKSAFKTTNNELEAILVKYLHSCTSQELKQLFDNFLFGFDVAGVNQLRRDVIVEVDEIIVVKKSQHIIVYQTADTADAVFHLLDTKQKTILFGYLLKCITEKETYFPSSSNKELLKVEESNCTVIVARLLTVHKLLSQLSESKEVQMSLRDRPEEIITYITNVLSSDAIQSEFLFVIVMILENLVLNSPIKTLEKYQVLVEPLRKISAKSANLELISYCKKTISTILEKTIQSTDQIPSEKTEFDKALEDVCDPLLPVRGHALIVLTKLIEKKDEQTMERKQYLLNLFQLHLKDDDSFIYLNAVQGLAALAGVFPDVVLEVLCEEFAVFTKNSVNSQNTRIKLGEVLVRVIKLLGEMAPKYKSLLLNTFLSTTKDDDHLIRASSLSNLGEVCRVLSYKLGTIVTEVLVCVHSIITTDKAVEARRAAVTVIRQLFVGLQSEMISFLKEEILPIYRTLKEIYYHDKDDVMRLQAQLALEELNENMKNFVFPTPQLNLEKKIIMLD